MQGSRDEIPSPLEPILELFERHGVEHILIGGMAQVLHGGFRPTFDVDFCYRRSPENLERLAQALGEIHPTLRGAPADLPFTLDARSLEAGDNFTFNTDHGPLDLLGWVEPLGDYDQVLAESIPLLFGDRTVPTLSLNGLITIKEHLGRPKDLAALEELRAIKREREE